MCLFHKAFAKQPDGSEIEEAPNSDTESEDELEFEEAAESGHQEAKQADHSGIKCSTLFPKFSFLPLFMFWDALQLQPYCKYKKKMPSVFATHFLLTSNEETRKQINQIINQKA